MAALGKSAGARSFLQETGTQRTMRQKSIEEAAKKQKVQPDTLRIWEGGLKRYSPKHAHRLIHLLT